MPYPRNEFPAELRAYRCDGTHGLTYTRVVTDSDPDGSIELEVEFCADPTCATFTRTTCQHANNEWQYTSDYKPAEPGDLDGEGNSALLCTFCGKDGT